MARKKRRAQKKRSGGWIGRFFSLALAVLIRSLPFLGVIAVGYGAVAGMQAYLLNDRDCLVTNIRVTTDRAYPKEDVLTRGGIRAGENIFTINIDAIARQLRKDPRLEDVTVTRVLPNTLDIDLKVRERYAYLLLGNSYYLVDPRGFVIGKTRADQKDAHYPLIEDRTFAGQRVLPGSQYFTGGIESCFFVIEYLRKSSLIPFETIDLIVIDRLGSISLKMKDGYEIRLGHTKLIENLDKLQHLPSILKNEDKTRIKYIDMRFDDIIVKK